MAKVTPIKAPVSAGGDFEIAPEGVFLARCYKMVDVGTQTETGQYGTKENRKIYLYWELLQDDDGEEIRMEDGQPFSIFNSYKLSMHQKANLRKHLDAWRGKKFTEEEAADFDLTKLLGAFCKLQITHSTSKDGQKTYANIEAIMSTKKKVDGVNEISSFNIENPDMEVFNDLPQWLQDKIEDAPEWQDDDSAEEEAPAAPAKKAAEKEDDDQIDIADVPF
jgi:hypothetical protein